jgi:hypothetical protein
MTHPPISAEADPSAERARVAFVEHNWSEAIVLLRAADAGGALTPPTSMLTGRRLGGWDALGKQSRCESRHLPRIKEAGDPRRAAATALALASDCSHRLEGPVASGWVRRAEQASPVAPPASAAPTDWRWR